MSWQQISLWFAYGLFLVGLLSLGSNTLDFQKTANSQGPSDLIQSTP